jgi:hypothetical protein
VTVARDIASARAAFESAEREKNPDLKAHALEDAMSLLAAFDADQLTEAEARLIANLRLAHTRRLLVQLVGLSAVSMDAWFGYIGLLLGELRPEVERLTEADAELRENYERFLALWGADIGEILQGHKSPGVR